MKICLSVILIFLQVHAWGESLRTQCLDLQNKNNELIEAEKYSAAQVERAIEFLKQMPEPLVNRQKEIDAFAAREVSKKDIADFMAVIGAGRCPVYYVYGVLDKSFAATKKGSPQWQTLYGYFKTHSLNLANPPTIFEVHSSLDLVKKHQLGISKEANSQAAHLYDEIRKKIRQPYPQGFDIDYEEIDKATGSLKKHQAAFLSEFKEAAKYREQLLKLVP